MPITAAYSPGWIMGGQNGTQFVGNPWASPNALDSPVWIQCAMTGVAGPPGGSGPFAAWGIWNVDYFDDNGNLQQSYFGELDNNSDTGLYALAPRLFVPRFLGVTFALLSQPVAQVVCSATLFLFQ